MAPDLSVIIQEVISRDEWSEFNSIVIIISGAGTRTAEAYNGKSQNAALIVAKYTTELPVYQCADGLINFPGDPGCLSCDKIDFLGNTLRVPRDYFTIQAAINAVQDGDLVLVSSGTYPGDLFVLKRITIASNFINTENQQYITNTIISGGRWFCC